METSEDKLLDGRVSLRQPLHGYRANTDSVLLAAATPAKKGEIILDVGSGVGAAFLCLATRVPDCRIVGLEIQEELVKLAHDNIAANYCLGRIEAVLGSVELPPPNLLPGSFDHVMSNPPFHEFGKGTPSPSHEKELANRENSINLDTWVKFCINMLRPKGTLAIIHRADRLDDLMAAIHGKMGAISIMPLWPRKGQAAKRIIIRGRKSVASPSILLPGMILHEYDGAYTSEAAQILRHLQPL